MMRWFGSVLAAALLSVAGGAAARPADAAFTRRFEAFVDQLRRDPAAPIGFAVVAVVGDRTLVARAHGVRDIRNGAPMTLDTPVYTASTTKAFVGLMAAQADAAGSLPLTATLRDVWPSITLPPPLDPGQVTARRLLAHVSGVESPVLGWLYSDTGAYRSEDVPDVLSRHAVPANREFDYGNVGPVIYTAMLEARLGRSWRDALQTHVAQPLGMTHTSARLEDFAPAAIAQCHARQQGAWTVVAHKPTALLDAGGGVIASAADAGRFLRAFTSDGASTAGRIAPQVLRRTYERVATQDREFQGFRRDGYGLGWDLSDYQGQRVVSRSGGYPGCRSIMAFLPEHQFGVLVFSLTDVGANLFGASLVQQGIDYWTGRPDADARATERITAFRSLAATAQAEADRAAGPPANRAVVAAADYVGWYADPGRGRVALSWHPEGLEARAGAMRLLLAGVEADRFHAYDANLPGEPRPLTFRRDAAGRVTGFDYRDGVFERETAR